MTNLQKIMKEKNVTLRELSDYLGYNGVATLNRFVKNTQSLYKASFRTVDKIARYLEVSVYDIIEESDIINDTYIYDYLKKELIKILKTNGDTGEVYKFKGNFEDENSTLILNDGSDVYECVFFNDVPRIEVTKSGKELSQEDFLKEYHRIMKIERKRKKE